MTLIQATKIIGLKVITLDGGKEIDTVKDVIYDPQENRVKALLVDKQGWFKDAKIISVEKIESIGKDAVIIQNEDAVESASQNSKRVANIAHDKNYLTKTKIITVDGDDLGNVTDLYFSLPYGNVQEFEVSGGLISDLKSGRNTIAVTDIVTIGSDATIVKSYAGIKIEDQNKTQGVQGVATSAAGIAGVIGDKAKEAWEMTKTKAGEAKEYVDSGKLQSDTDSVVESAKTKAQEIKEDLAPRIEKIKEDLGPKIENIKEKMGDMASQAKDKVVEMGSKAKDKAEDMGSDAKNVIEEKTDQATQSIQFGLKDAALGQYLKTNIIGRNDEVIASVGDMVTREILDAAEQNEQLNRLLTNLSKLPINL